MSQNFKDIYFSPVQDFNLINGDIKYLATGNLISEVRDNKQLQPIFNVG